MPDTSTEVAIATTTLSSSGTISFTSIPNTYTDIRLILVATAANAGSAGQDVLLQFNSDTATNYSMTMVSGSGAAASSTSVINYTSIDLDYVSTAISQTVPSLWTADIFSYAGSTFKTVLGSTSEDRNGSGYVQRTIGLWRSTSAITSIQVLLSNAGTFAAGTTATLYGIL